MKKQFLREHHNRQDKTKKPDSQESLQQEGDNFDRGGVPKTKYFSIRGNSIFPDRKFLTSLESDDKISLFRTLEGLKFVFNGESGTIFQLKKNGKITADIEKRYQMTQKSILQASKVVEKIPHPKRKSLFPVLEFSCFLKPEEPFQKPIFKKLFAFRAKIIDRSHT